MSQYRLRSVPTIVLMPDVRAGALRFTYVHEGNEGRKEPAMYTIAEIELSRQHREDVARQVENNRLARQLRAARSGMSAGTGNALLARFRLVPTKGTGGGMLR